MHKDIDKYDIFHGEPSDWKDLQIKVGQVLNDIGFDTEVEKDIDTVRGKVNVDVYAENSRENPKTIIIAECKNWNNSIPKSVVHSLRTVINDYGANFGFIISKVGFQKGAYEAIDKSNVQLLNWVEFPEYFKLKWIETIVKSIDRIGKPLWYFTSPMQDFYDSELEKLSESKKNDFFVLVRKYSEFAFYSNKDYYLNHFTGEIEYLDQAIEKIKKTLPIKVNCYSDYFYFIRSYCQEGLNAIDELFGKQIRKY